MFIDAWGARLVKARHAKEMLELQKKEIEAQIEALLNPIVENARLGVMQDHETRSGNWKTKRPGWQNNPFKPCRQKVASTRLSDIRLNSSTP